MKVLIVGGPRPLATALTQALLDRNRLTDSAGRERGIDRIVELDAAPADKSADRRIRRVTGRADDPTLLGELIDADYGAIFDLGTVGAADGAALDATRLLLEIVRETGHRPRFVFATSLDVDEAALPLAALSAAGHIDGRRLRLAVAGPGTSAEAAATGGAAPAASAVPDPAPAVAALIAACEA
ncbi:hypothetical protein [Derxia gummosa]|uniref:NAD(P)-binding domain-containing protein n=1 Tax=Derxia gummosa DSM 723 TaxID=1121388 RepID=A0A8B6X1D1_9BURK|nr:hypothetical protein [Derxia gummosa]